MADHTGHRQRMKEEFLARPDSFQDHRLLELILFYANPRSDTNPMAHDLMDRFGSLTGVLDALPEELRKLPGVGDHTAVLLKAIKELARRYFAGRTDLSDTADSSEAYARVLQHHFLGARNEIFCVLCMDGKHKILGDRFLGEGNVNTVQVTTRLIVEAVLAMNATVVVLAHNHVSGLALPSPDDVATTNALRDILSQVGVVLEDHLVFTDDDMVSMRDSGFYTPEG